MSGSKVEKLSKTLMKASFTSESINSKIRHIEAPRGYDPCWDLRSISLNFDQNLKFKV